MRHILKTSLTLLLLATFTAEAIGSPRQAGTIEGTVVRSDTKGPIPGVLITLSSGPMDSISARALQIAASSMGAYFTPSTANGEEVYLQTLTDTAASRGLSPGNADLITALHNYMEQTTKFKAYTQNDGTFSVGNLPPGRYTVRTERDGYFSARNGLATLDVAAGASRSSLSMTPGATVGGRVRDSDGELLANATVQAMAITYLNGYPTLTTAVTTKTNYRGEYRLFWMKEGDYIIAATADGIATLGARTFFPGTPELAGATTVPLKTGDNIEGVDFSMTNARLVKISGELISTAPPPTAESLGLPPGMQLPPGLILPNTVRMAMVLRDPNAPETADDPFVKSVPLENNRGTFEFTAPPGKYDLLAGVEGGGAGRIALDVGDRDIQGVTLTLQPSISIKGTVKSNGGTVDLNRIRLRLLPDGKMGPMGGGIILGNPTTQADGSFTLPVPVEGRYRVETLGLPPGMYIADVVQNGSSAFDTGLSVSSNTAPIEVLFNTDAGTLTGIVQDSSGKPAVNVTISVVPAEARRANRSLYKTNRTNGQGRFTIGNIPPGNYKVFAWRASPDGSFFNATYLARYEDKGKAVTVAPSATVDTSMTIANEP